MRRSVVIMFSLFSASMLVSGADAHEVRPAYLEIVETAPNRFDILWKQPSAGTLIVRLTPKLSNGLLDSPPTAVYAANSFVIQRWTGRNLARDTFDRATLRIEGLERTITDVLVNIHFASEQRIQALLKPSQPKVVIHLAGTGKFPVLGYLNHGIEHILTGFDHLSFVFVLLVLIQGRLKLLKTITAFTVGHSITLAAATLGYVHVNSQFIESVVALSIIFTSVELARSVQGHEGIAIRYPWLIASTFGLLHGFAFAGSLVSIGLPHQNIAGALMLFNCGVEIGQVLFVCATLALTSIVRRLRWVMKPCAYRRIVSYSIGTLASYWMFERTFSLV